MFAPSKSNIGLVFVVFSSRVWYVDEIMVLVYCGQNAVLLFALFYVQ